ncbi:hypothetical protein ETB97_010371 [Aspergillus alliaceus]|uniref:Uncharacterized protein n=1 Tax=Petromyces alliaceus TaxID=209559 RepID=A0A8H6E8B7_PETAA|nr:hypothetical protein ETB97_010371 [Aspergillus burnettii]
MPFKTVQVLEYSVDRIIVDSVDHDLYDEAGIEPLFDERTAADDFSLHAISLGKYRG